MVNALSALQCALGGGGGGDQEGSLILIIIVDLLFSVSLSLFLCLLLPLYPSSQHDQRGSYVGFTELVQGVTLSDYTPQLLALDRLRPCHRVLLPDNLQQITTLLRLETWKEELVHHLDRQLAGYILHGIQNGFQVGFNYQQQTLVAKDTNMLSSMQGPQVVEEYLREEVFCKRIVKLTQSEACKLGIHCSPFGVIPKKHKPNKWTSQLKCQRWYCQRSL